MSQAREDRLTRSLDLMRPSRIPRGHHQGLLPKLDRRGARECGADGDRPRKSRPFF